MKTILLKSIMFLVTLASLIPAHGKSYVIKLNDEQRIAVDVLKGKDLSQTKAWAIETLEKSLEENRDAYVLNVLGIAYLNGIGIEADEAKGVAYLEESGERDFDIAYHNLGMYYKYAKNGRQNFVKACEAFDKGIQAGSLDCYYIKGFMLYKGLGCEQNYAEAVKMFEKATEKEHPYALYMLGLCYRNGYGVEADTARANFFLRRAEKLNHKGAMEELLKKEPENNPKRRYVNIDKKQVVPEEMPTISPYVPNNTTEIGGTYKGIHVTYDWSGKYVLSEKPMTLTMTVNGDRASGIWLQGNDSIPFSATLTKQGELIFDNTEVTIYDRYAPSNAETYRYEKSSVSCGNGFLTGNLRMYSTREMEPGRPTYISLQRCGDAPQNLLQENYDSKIYAYPNPFTDRVNLYFELEEDVPSAKIYLFSQNGTLKQAYELGAVESGEHTYTIMPNDMAEKSYVVNVVAGKYKYQTIIFRDRK